MIHLAQGDHGGGGRIVVDEQVAGDDNGITAALHLHRNALHGSQLRDDDDVVQDGKPVDVRTEDRASQENVVRELAVYRGVGSMDATQGNGLGSVGMVDE